MNTYPETKVCRAEKGEGGNESGTENVQLMLLSTIQFDAL